MAGHSQFKNIMFRKGAQDAKRAKLFTKIQREITSAVKSGLPDPAANPRLRAAIQKARGENMPNDKIDAAVKRGSGPAAGDSFDEIRYEGYGPGGVAIIIEALTDNRNRTASDVRSCLTKQGGNLGETGSVGFLFDRVGLVVLPASVSTEEAMLDAAIEAGAENCALTSEGHEITCAAEQFHEVRDALEKRFGAPRSAKLVWHPKTSTPLGEEQAASLLKMLDALEDLDDVQEVFTNVELSDAILHKLSAA